MRKFSADIVNNMETEEIVELLNNLEAANNRFGEEIDELNAKIIFLRNAKNSLENQLTIIEEELD